MLSLSAADARERKDKHIKRQEVLQRLLDGAHIIAVGQEGDCQFEAVMVASGTDMAPQQLRSRSVAWMRATPDRFRPFCTDDWDSLPRARTLEGGHDRFWAGLEISLLFP